MLLYQPTHKVSCLPPQKPRQEQQQGEQMSSAADMRKPRSWFKSRQVITIKIGDHKLTVMNCLRPKVLKLDNDTATFIAEFVSKQLTNSCDQEAPSQPAMRVPKSDLHVDESLTPNKRNKVVWDSLIHSWTLHVAKPTNNEHWGKHKDHNGMSLSISSIDNEREPETYQKAKVQAYLRAIEAWNLLDGSKRHRIAMPTVLY